MKLKTYLKEGKDMDIKKVKKEIISLKKGKLTAQGARRLQYLEDYLIKQGIFDHI